MGNKTKSERRLLLSENILPMQESGQQFYQRPEGDYLEQSELGFGIFFADGHTDKQMIPHIQYNGKTIVLWLI
jgi:predicted metal-dependent peptidase